MEKDINCDFTDSASEKNMNIHTVFTNASQTFLDEREKISVQSIPENTERASPAFLNEKVPPMLHAVQFSSESNILDNSGMSPSYFTDPTVHRENEQVSAETSSMNSDRYFSTPMPSKERVRKKLTPVMEINFDPNMSEGWQHEDSISTTDLLHKKTHCADVLCESATMTPLYKSFFADECQEIATRIENVKRGARWSPGKNKLEAFDVSTIDAEPPPFDSTSMKSRFCSMESGITQEGLSLFGDSILDFEKTDFNSTGCGIGNNNKMHTIGDMEQLSLSSDDEYNIHPKRQKTEPLEKIDWKVNVSKVNKRPPLRNVEKLTLETPTMKSLHIYATRKCGEGRTDDLSKNVVHTEHTLSGNAVELCANSTQDILNYDELPPIDATHVIEVSHTRLSSTSVPEEVTAANVTHEIEIKHTFNAMLDIPFIEEDVNIVNTTQVIEMVGHPSGSTTQDFTPVHDDATSGNTTQVMDVAPMAANTEQDITPIPEMINAASTTQIIAVESQLPMNTTQYISSMQESKMATNTTCRIGMELQSCVNTTQNIASSQHIVISNLSFPDITQPNAEISVSNPGSDLNAEKKNICERDLAQETLVVGDGKELPPIEPKAQMPHSYFTPVTTDPCIPSQVKLNVTEWQNMEGHEKYRAFHQKEVDICKELRNQQLLSESCSMSQEDDSHDVSVFSVSSMTFVTSTPVPGINNFQFQNSCRGHTQQDPNMSICSSVTLLEESSNTEPRIMTQQKSYRAQGLDCKDKGKEETSRVSFLPPSMQRSMSPPSEAAPKQMPSTSGIPSVRHSLALYQNTSQNPAFSKSAPRSGIPGRGMMRPPLARQGLARATLRNPKQAMEGTGGSGMTNKTTENKCRGPKAAVVKTKAATTQSQLPTAPSSIKSSSQMSAIGTTRRLPVVIRKATAVRHDITKSDTVSAVCPQTSGFRTGLPKPGASSVSMLQSRNVPMKPKSKVQGEQKWELPKSKHERCQHLEVCKGCQLLNAYKEFMTHFELANYEHGQCKEDELCKCSELLKMREELKSIFGQVEMAGT